MRVITYIIHNHIIVIILPVARPPSRTAIAPVTGFQTGSGQTGFLQKCRNIPKL